MQQLPLPLGFDPQQGFDEYHPGSNAESVSHLQALARGSGESLIFLWGSAGLGKSHLLNATCREAYSRRQSCAYLPLRSLREQGPCILEGLDTLDLVCLDDVDSVVGNSPWEQALFALFNRLRDVGSRLLASARQPPAELPVMLPDLKTRLGWGLTLLLRPLDDADQSRALVLQAKTLGLDLSPAVANFLLTHHQRDPAALRRLLESLDRATLAAQRRLTVPFVKAYLEQSP